MPKIGVSLIVLIMLIIFLAGCNKNEQNGDETKMQSLVGYVVLKDNEKGNSHYRYKSSRKRRLQSF
ncbi:lipoprotein, putative [Bacillus subtilis]|nr:lipoprotein, putative [Bacillus subtilis]